MYNKVLMFLVTGIFVLGINKLSFAMMCGSSTAHGEHTQVAYAESADPEHEHGKTPDTQAHSEEAVNVGNKICPVSGEEIKEEEAFQVEHEGKIYNLCCKMCAKDFKKDPEKYIEKLKELEKKEEESQAGHTHEGHTHEHTH